jgi:hypothetical protein
MVGELVEGYSMDNIYNADKTGLNWKALPRKTLASLKKISDLAACKCIGALKQ